MKYSLSPLPFARAFTNPNTFQDYRGGQKLFPRFGEFFRQVEREDVSNSRNKILPAWNHLFCPSLHMFSSPAKNVTPTVTPHHVASSTRYFHQPSFSFWCALTSWQPWMNLERTTSIFSLAAVVVVAWLHNYCSVSQCDWAIQGLAKIWSPGCVNVVGKLFVRSGKQEQEQNLSNLATAF